MTFVDTSVFMYAVGRPHAFRDEARAFFRETLAWGEPLATSVEVLLELTHAYRPAGRLATLDAALTLARGRMAAIWPLEAEDLELAGLLAASEDALGARDLIHLACTRRRGVRTIRTFDRPLAAAARRI